MPVYAGIGSRITPLDMAALMYRCAYVLCDNGWTLRSGGAQGADTAFYAGCVAHPPPQRHEIYLPWLKFNTDVDPYLECPKPEAYEIAALYHPAWTYLKRGAKALLARNVHQVLGRDLDAPVKMIVCWTPDGSLNGQGLDSGGTGMALRVAAGEAPGVIVFNLAIPEHRERIERFCETGPGFVDE